MPTLANTKKAIWHNLLFIQNGALVVTRGKEIWLALQNHTTVNLNQVALLHYLWHENIQRKQNWTATFTNLKEKDGKSSQFLSSEQSCEPKSLDVCLKYCRSWKIHSENLWLRSTLEAIRFDLWMPRSISDGGNLCPLWLVILKSVWYRVGNT